MDEKIYDGKWGINDMDVEVFHKVNSKFHTYFVNENFNLVDGTSLNGGKYLRYLAKPDLALSYETTNRPSDCKVKMIFKSFGDSEVIEKHINNLEEIVTKVKTENIGKEKEITA